MEHNTKSKAAVTKKEGAAQASQWQRTRLPVQETAGSTPGSGGPLEDSMAAHCSVLAWEIPWTEEPDRLRPWVCKESDMTEHTHSHTQRKEDRPLSYSVFRDQGKKYFYLE